MWEKKDVEKINNMSKEELDSILSKEEIDDIMSKIKEKLELYETLFIDAIMFDIEEILYVYKYRKLCKRK